MSRIEGLKDQEIPWYLRPFFWIQKKRYGAYLNPARIWARRPSLFWAMGLFVKTFERRGSPLPKTLRLEVALAVSQMNKCAFCTDIHEAQLKHSSAQSEGLKVAIEYAAAMTQTDLCVTELLFKKLREVFTEEQILELTALIAFQNLSAKFNAALDVPAQRLPE